MDAEKKTISEKESGGFIFYKRNLTANARNNRKNPTPAEIKLWYEVLRGKKLSNYKFLRQKPLDHFIVDFYCAELKLAIELDGDSHGDQAEYDNRRTKLLNTYGVVVIRYTNKDILENIEGVFEDLSKRIQTRRKVLK